VKNTHNGYDEEEFTCNGYDDRKDVKICDFSTFSFWSFGGEQNKASKQKQEIQQINELVFRVINLAVRGLNLGEFQAIV
jgi:hypothetical protein